MRTMLKCALGVEQSSKAIQEGRLPGIIEKLMQLTKPEAVYFTADNGTRTIYIYFDLKDASDMPPIGELIWGNLGGSVSFQPVMSPEELKTGLSKI